MDYNELYAKDLSFRHIGLIANFTSDCEKVRGEIRQIHHDMEATYIWLIPPDYDRTHNFEFTEYPLNHYEPLEMESEGESHG